MLKIIMLILILSLISTFTLAQDEEEFFGENEEISLVEEGSFQSEISPGYNFDYTDLENPEFQEEFVPQGEDPLWNNEYQNFENNEINPEE